MQERQQTTPVSSHLLFTLPMMLVLPLAWTLPAFAQQPNVQDKDYRAKILNRVDSLLEAKYVFPEKAKQCAEQFRRIYSSGAYEACSTAEEFAAKVSADLVAITHDKHLTFRVIKASDVGEKIESNLHHPVRYYRLRMKEHTGFTKLEWIDGRIGYLELIRFNALAEAKELLGAAMKFLADARAIIIDIRENGGGSGDYLSSYFLPHPTQLTGTYYRQEDTIEECWTSRDIEGERMLDVPLFLLVGKKTFSAAEAFAYDMKVRKRAILIGDSTKGGAHDVGYYKIDDQFEMYISIGRAVNPVTNDNWEGVGVIPDVLVPASSALDTAIALARMAADRFSIGKEASLKAAVEEMEVHLDRAEKLYREKKKERAQAAVDSLFRIGKQFGLITEFFINVLAYNYYASKDEDILIAILKKNIEFFPRSPTAYESLAYGYSAMGKTASALEYYSKAFELDPDNRVTAKIISKLQREMNHGLR
jgi:tetratricopeptide (TPR) repeat protein